MALCLIYRIPLKWKDEVMWLSKHINSKTFSDRLKKQALATSLYYVWKARNQMIHNHIGTNADRIVKTIVDEVRLIAATWRGESKTKENVDIALAWGLDLRCFDSNCE